MDYTQELTLDLNTNNAYSVLSAKQGDAYSRYIIVHLTKDNIPYLVDPSHSAFFRLRKPDGFGIINPAIVNNDGTITIELTPQCLATAGRGYADVTEYDINNTSLSTVSFILNIMAAPNVAGRATSSDEFLRLQEVIQAADEIIDESEAWAVGERSGIPIEDTHIANIQKTDNIQVEIDKGIFEQQVQLRNGESGYYKFECVRIDEGGIRIWNLTQIKLLIDDNWVDQGIIPFQIYPEEYGLTITRIVGREITIGSTVEVTFSCGEGEQYKNNARIYAMQARSAYRDFETLRVTANVIEPGELPYVTRSYDDSKLSALNFYLPKGATGDSRFFTFDIENGELLMNRTRNIEELDFSVNEENGTLEVHISI